MKKLFLFVWIVFIQPLIAHPEEKMHVDTKQGVLSQEQKFNTAEYFHKYPMTLIGLKKPLQEVAAMLPHFFDGSYKSLELSHSDNYDIFSFLEGPARHYYSYKKLKPVQCKNGSFVFNMSNHRYMIMLFKTYSADEGPELIVTVEYRPQDRVRLIFPGQPEREAEYEFLLEGFVMEYLRRSFFKSSLPFNEEKVAEDLQSSFFESSEYFNKEKILECLRQSFFKLLKPFNQTKVSSNASRLICNLHSGKSFFTIIENEIAQAFPKSKIERDAQRLSFYQDFTQMKVSGWGHLRCNLLNERGTEKYQEKCGQFLQTCSNLEYYQNLKEEYESISWVKKNKFKRI